MEIQNVIATADLKQSVDANQFVNYSWGTYDREYYGGRCGYIKDLEMRGRVTVFFTGKMISTGARSVQESIDHLDHALKLLVTVGLVKKVRLEHLIRNIVATHNLHSKLDLNTISKVLQKIVFEPEQFPGIIYFTPEGPTCLIFSTGKLVVVGAKSVKQLNATKNSLELILDKYRAPAVSH